ncbi:MAG: hypothetical protein ACRELE_00510, partial [Gemmatimonadales bacterium]
DEVPPMEPQRASNPWTDKVDEARAGLRVRRIELERAELDRIAAEESERRQQRARDAARSSDERQASTRAKEDEVRRLEGLRQYGDTLAVVAGAPTEYRAKVTRDLSSYVTSAQFPRSAWAQAYQFIQARVDKVLHPWRDGQERIAQQEADEREEATGRQRRKELIQWGLSYANRETQVWDERDRSDLAREVKDALVDEIGPDSTRDDAIALVDDILREWDE